MELLDLSPPIPTCPEARGTIELPRPERSGPGRENPVTSGQALTEKTPPPGRRVGEAVAHVQADPTGKAKGPRARLVTGSQLPGHLGFPGWLVCLRHMKANNEHEDSAPGSKTMTDEEIWKMIEEDFGLPKVIPATNPPSTDKANVIADEKYVLACATGRYVGEKVEFNAHEGRPAGTGVVRVFNERMVSIRPDGHDAAYMWPVEKVCAVQEPRK